VTYGQLAAAVNEAMRPPAVPHRTRSLAQVTDALIAQQTTGTSPAQAMSLPALHAVVRLIASTIDQLDIVTDTGPAPNWLRRPRAYGSALDLGDLIQHTVSGMALHGRAYLLARRTTSGWRLDALHPNSVHCLTSATGIVDLSFLLDGEPIERVPAVPGDWQPGARYLVHVPYLVTPSRPEGTSPVVDAWQALAGYLAVERQAANLLDGGTYSGGRLETDHDLTVEQAKRYREQWIINRQTGQIPVLGGGIRYASDAIDPVKAQFLETRLANAQAIGSLYGVPPSMLGMTMAGGSSSLSYANAQDQRISFRQSCLEAFTSQIEDALTPLLARPGRTGAEEETIRFDYTEWETNGADTEPAAVPADNPVL
jgi:HK97 family phage portal protein